jgi:tetratricopeptide (TPR) repeat protein
MRLARTTPLLVALLAGTAIPGTIWADENHKTELFAPGVGHAEGGITTLSGGPVMIEGLGDYGMQIKTSSPEAEAWFAQGLGHLWGFNHAEAVRAFRQAQASDPSCAMCYWGEAYALGPNLNDGMHDEAIVPAFVAAQKAADLAAEPKEVALTQALLARYAPDGGDRTELNAAFVRAMLEVVDTYPDDANILALTADALMNTQPWDYWEMGGQQPKGHGATILATLERAMEINPDHPGALHLYLHAVEASANPTRGEAAADRLAALNTTAGHLAHMPAHIYNRIGRYADSIAVNKAAIEADEAFLAQAGDAASPLYRYGYYPHNVHFLLVGAQNAGLKDEALAAAEKLGGITSDEVSDDLAWVQAIRTAPYSAHVQFSDVQTILALDQPSEAFPFVLGFWHYVRGTAMAREGLTLEAQAEADAIASLVATSDFSGLEAQYLPAGDVLTIARLMIEARIAQTARDYDAAVALLEEAAAIEATIPYMEPAYWPTPVRRTLGAVHLQAGRPMAAIAAFKASLIQAPRDGWALWGLMRAWDEISTDAEDQDDYHNARAAFRKAWLGDVTELDMNRL